jgi:hypothetical protein
MDRIPVGDTTQLFRIYALLALSRGESVTLEDVHNAWAVWMLEQNTSHEALVPFAQLDSETAEEDRPFVRAIHQALHDR